MDFPSITANVPSVNTVMNGAQKAGRTLAKGALITAIATAALGGIAVAGAASAVESLLDRDKSPKSFGLNTSGCIAVAIAYLASTKIDDIARR